MSAAVLSCSLSVAAPALAQTPPKPPASAQTTKPAAEEEEPDLINPDRPGIADGSRVLGRAGFQIEFGLQQEFHTSDAVKTRVEFVPTLARIGLGSRFEARIETNAYTWNRITTPDGAPTADNGFAPVSAGFKYQIFDTGGSPRHSAGLIVRVFPSSGTGDLASHHLAADARLAVDWDLSDKWSLNPNAGIARYEADDGQTFVAGLLALTLNYTPSATLNPFIDAGYQVPNAPGAPGSVIVDGGLAWIIGHDVQIDVSAGAGRRNLAPRPFWAVGLSVRKLRHR